MDSTWEINNGKRDSELSDEHGCSIGRTIDSSVGRTGARTLSHWGNDGIIESSSRRWDSRLLHVNR